MSGSHGDLFVWITDTSSHEKRAIVAALAGYGLNSFDFMIYTFIIPSLTNAWGMSKAQAGYIATISLITSAVGGCIAGILADRFGRVRVLQWSILWFILFTLPIGFVSSFPELLFARAMQGIGVGGEWAVGAVLVAETVQARHRGKAIGLVQSSWAVGWGIAVAAYWMASNIFPTHMTWRVLFWLELLPAVSLFFFRRDVHEPEIFRATRTSSKHRKGSAFLHIFSVRMLPTTVLASLLSTGMMGAYFSVATWLPTFLSVERKLTAQSSSTYLFTLILGSFLGYLTSAHLSDHLGRRRAFVVFASCASVLTVSYTHMRLTDNLMLLLGLPLGFFLSGIFSGMGAFLAELFPNEVRGTGQGFCYNSGRAVGAAFPAMVGALSNSMLMGEAICLFVVGGYLLVILSCLPLPETQGRELAIQT